MNIPIYLLFNFFVGPILIFFTSIALIELMIFILRIKNSRVIYFARCAILLKLVFSFLMLDFSNWAILHKINPCLCQAGSRTLNVLFSMNNFFPKFSILMNLPSGKLFTLQDILCFLIKDFSAIALISIFLIVMIFNITKFIFSCIKSKSYINRIYSSLTLISIADIKTAKNIILAKSTLITSPCTIRKEKKWFIVFPSNFRKILTNDEIPCVIYHELQHIRFFDYYSFIILSFLTALFSFIPLIKTWLRKIDFTKECACDENINPHPYHIANALKKYAIANMPKYIPTFARSTHLVKRIQNLATKKENTYFLFRFFKYLLLTFIILALFSGKIWTF